MPADLEAAVIAVAAHRLPLAATDGPIHVTAERWPALAERLVRERLTGLAVRAFVDGAISLTEDSVAELRARDQTVQRQAVRAEAVTLALCDELDRAEIDHRVLKGPAHAHGVYPDPALRPFRDVDLLVRATDLTDVVRRCAARGAVRRLPELRPGFDRRFAKSVTLRDRSGIEVDLHRTLAVGPLGQLIPVQDLWGPARRCTISPDLAIPALPHDQAFVHACIHAGCGRGPTLLSLRDLLELERHVDLAACAAIAHRWTATEVVRRAVAALTAGGLPAPDRLVDWAAGLDPTKREVAVADAYSGARPRRRRIELATLRYVRGPLQRLRFTHALVWPSSDNRRARGRTARGQLGRIWRTPS